MKQTLASPENQLNAGTYLRTSVPPAHVVFNTPVHMLTFLCDQSLQKSHCQFACSENLFSLPSLFVLFCFTLSMIASFPKILLWCIKPFPKLKHK